MNFKVYTAKTQNAAKIAKFCAFAFASLRLPVGKAGILAVLRCSNNEYLSH